MSKDPFVEAYMEKGFGSMNKNDVEVWVFNDLLQGKLNGKSNYDISRALKIPESKVKRLRYEAELVYGRRTDEDSVALLKGVLEKGVKAVGDRFQFVVEDVALRKYIDNYLKSKGYFSDGSFNSEIVSVSVDVLIVLLKKADIYDLVDEYAQKVAGKRSEKYDVKAFFENVLSECKKKTPEIIANSMVVLTRVGLEILVNILLTL